MGDIVVFDNTLTSDSTRHTGTVAGVDGAQKM